MELPWKTKGIVLTAPLTNEVNDVAKFIREYLAKKGFNMVVLQTRYRYKFKSHPEIRGYDPLSYEDVKTLLDACKESGIKLVPKMNLIAHQSGVHNNPTDGIIHGHNYVAKDIKDGLLEAYPQFDEEKEKDEIYYTRNICLSNDDVKHIVFDLIDELMEVFESDSIHIGCDEAFGVGLCEKCKTKPKEELIANWVNAINDHVKSKNGQMYMWGDRLFSVAETGYDEWESSNNGTEKAREILSKDVIICDWHYNLNEKYPSVDILAREGFKMMVSPWRNKEGAEAFLNYAKNHDYGHIKGLLTTTWCGSGDLAKRILYGEEGKWEHTNQIAATLDELYS